MTRGKIVLIAFPYDDFSNIKIRPALCLTNPIGEHEHLVLAFIGSQIKAILGNSDLLISKDSDYFSKTGLKTTSIIHLHRLITISRNALSNEIGELPQDVLNIALEKIISIFKHDMVL